MLKIFNNLEPFFMDNYRRIGVREYARIRKVSPPTASKLLAGLNKAGLLEREDSRNFKLYYANRENTQFIQLSRIFWLGKVTESGLIQHLETQLVKPVIILFGSFSKAEVNEHSDIDIAVFSPSAAAVDLKRYESRLRRNIHLLRFSDREAVANPQLLNNILNGFILRGAW